MLQQQWGIENHQVIAFGDNNNDIEMPHMQALAAQWLRAPMSYEEWQAISLAATTITAC